MLSKGKNSRTLELGQKTKYHDISVKSGDKRPSYSTVKSWVVGFRAGHLRNLQPIYLRPLFSSSSALCVARDVLASYPTGLHTHDTESTQIKKNVRDIRCRIPLL
jgi:hypothetical protein